MLQKQAQKIFDLDGYILDKISYEKNSDILLFCHLQKKHPQVYEKFFADNDIVMSSSFSFSLSPGIMWRVGSPLIRLKLPIKTYVGIKKIDKKQTIEMGQVLEYSTKDENFFETGAHVQEYFEKSIPFVKKLIQKKMDQDFSGIQINYLFEGEEMKGTDSSFESITMAAVYLYFRKCTVDEMRKIPTLKSMDVINQTGELEKLFRELQYDTTKSLALKMHGGVAGTSAFSAIVNSKTPLIYFTEERAGSEKKPFKDLKPYFLDNIDKLDDLRIWGFRLEELVDVEGCFPLDVVSIHPGSVKDAPMIVEYVHKSLLPKFDEIRDDVKKIFQDKVDLTSKRLPPFLQDMELDGKYWHEYAVGQTYQLVVLMMCMIDLYKNKLSKHSSYKFLENLTILMNINGVFEGLPSVNLQTIFSKLTYYAKKNGVDIGIRALYWGKMDGNIFAFNQTQKFRNGIFRAVDEIKKSHNEDVHIDFVSWRDGWGEDGLRVEQFMSQDIYSEFVDKAGWRLGTWDSNGKDNKIVGKDGINFSEFDLLLDKIDNKIYVAGEKVNSKELPSQVSTIEFIECLLDNGGKVVENKNLPKSNYAKYRNELQGKIITPLDKLIKAKINKSLGVKISGKLMDFYVEFEPRDLKIGIIDHI